jgi:hypothetical protein
MELFKNFILLRRMVAEKQVLKKGGLAIRHAFGYNDLNYGQPE